MKPTDAGPKFSLAAPSFATYWQAGEVGLIGKAACDGGEIALDNPATSRAVEGVPPQAPEVKPSEPSVPSEARTVPTRYRCGCGEVLEFASLVAMHQAVDWCGAKTWTAV